MPITELEHTADVRMKITADSMENLFSESAFALSKTLFGDYIAEEPTDSFEIEASGKDDEQRAVNFLSEVLFLTETEYIVPQKISVSIHDSTVKGIIEGVEFDKAKHCGGTEVKGISYCGLSLSKKEYGYELIIIFDI
ncbi:MAG TPA: archease [Methanocorpusculum sp.]|nr:archease [Methanocorpusculum sp.]